MLPKSNSIIISFSYTETCLCVNGAFIKVKEIYKILSISRITKVINSHVSRYKPRLQKHSNQFTGKLTATETTRRLRKQRDIFDEKSH